jgi:hypothetical protein
VSDRKGSVTGIRYYKSVANTGQHIGRLWSATGDLLGSALFINETAAGWQQAFFATPVGIDAGSTYVASYHTATGHYSASPGEFGASLRRGPLTAPASSAGAPNGVYRYGAGGFPNNTFSSSNYWVDVMFVDTGGPSLIALSPANGNTTVAPQAVISATFDEQVQPDSIVFELRDEVGALAFGATAYDPTTRTASFTPAASLSPAATYTATIRNAADTAGNMMASTSWSFTVTGLVFTSVFAAGATPAVADSFDTDAVELGMKFNSSVAGHIHGVRFFKGGTANSGLHRGSLWSSAGDRLASVNFAGETASGWLNALFDAPVAIAANTTYVVSYLAPVGRYSVTGGYFNNQSPSNGPLTGLANGADGGNGLYRYGAEGGFPTYTYNGGNYWVDVLFTQS